MARRRPKVLNMIARNPEFHLHVPRYGGSVSVFGPFRFAPGDGLWRDGRPVAMPPRAVAVLTTLLAAPGSIVSKQELMDAVWPDTFVTESSLLEAVGLVREALGDDRRNPTYIQTVHRRGYRFIASIEPAAPRTLEPGTQPVELLEPVEPVDFSEPLRPILLRARPTL
jgi:DNA-binding winged helix-turn-helix (wHTH) protein